MTVAALVLGIVGTVLAAASLTWNIVAYRLREPRPKLLPVVGVRSSEGIVTTPGDASSDDSLRRTATQYEGELIFGVQVINCGRAPFHVFEWGLRSEPAGRTWVPRDDQMFAGAPAPAEIAPGATCSFFADLQHARDLSAAAVEGDRTQRLVVIVSGGGRTYRTKPLSSALITFER